MSLLKPTKYIRLSRVFTQKSIKNMQHTAETAIEWQQVSVED